MKPIITLLLTANAFVAFSACSDDTNTTPDSAIRKDSTVDGPASDGPRRDGSGRDAPGRDGPSVIDRGADFVVDGDGTTSDGPRLDIARDLLADAPIPCTDPGVDLPGDVTVSPSSLVAGQSVTVRYSGKLAKTATTVRLHYSFDNWSWKQPPGSPHKSAKQVAMTKVGNVWEVTVPIIAGAHQLDFVFTNQDESSWDNNSKKDWHRPIGGLWMGPYLTWRDNLVKKGADRDPSQSIMVNFRSWRACKARVRWGTSARTLTQEQDESQSSKDHHLLLTGLKPATTYHYKVGCLPSSGSCFLDTSAVYSFRTPPANPTDVKLIVLADPQNYNHPQDRWQDVAATLAKPPHNDANAVMIAGDLAADDTPDNWRTFFRLGVPVLSSIVLLPAVGNHDTPTFGSNADTSTFEALFAVDSSSGRDSHYGVTLGPVTIFSLNSETAQKGVGAADDWKPGGAQYTWLSNSLSLVKTTWTFAFWHIGPFNAGVRHSNQNDTTRTILPLFDQRVDWVFNGHEHMCQRTKPLRYTGMSSGKPQVEVVADYGTRSQDGVGYLHASAAGHYPAADELLPASNPVRAYLAYPKPSDISGDKLKSKWVGFTIVSLKGKTITLNSYEVDKPTQPRDSVSYVKP